MTDGPAPLPAGDDQFTEYAQPGSGAAFNVNRKPVHDDTVRAWLALGSLGVLAVLTVLSLILIWRQPDRPPQDLLVILTPFVTVTSGAVGYYFAKKRE